MTSLTSFDLFSSLPPELQDHIWTLIALSTRRTIDIWADFVCCTRSSDAAMFYMPKYSSELTKLSHPPILSTCQASRKIALNYYVLEYETHMMGSVQEPSMYINYHMDTLVPRGHWNYISFDLFMWHVRAKGLVSMAVDVHGDFWKDNLKEYLRMWNWPGNGTKELVLYEGERDGVWKDSEYLSRFRRRQKGDKRVLELENLTVEASQELLDVKVLLERSFDAIEEGQRPTLDESPRWLRMDTCEPTTKEEFMRPAIHLQKLIAHPSNDEHAATHIEQA